MRVLLELLLTAVLVIPFFLRPPFMVTFESWFAMRVKLLMVNPNWAGVRLLLTVFAIALVCSVAIAIHECGHLLAGLALGFRCRSFRVGRIKIDRGFKISRFQDAEDSALGWAHMVPVRTKRFRLRCAAMILTGPLANLLSAFLVIKAWPHQTLISGSFIGVSVYLGLGNLLPLHLPGHISDGRRLLMLLFDPGRSERSLALATLMEQIDDGVPLAGLDSADLERATNIHDQSHDTAHAHAIAYLVACSRNDQACAARHLETALRSCSHASSALREMLAVQAAYFQITCRNRSDLAEQWLAEKTGRRVLLEARSSLEETISRSKESPPVPDVMKT